MSHEDQTFGELMTKYFMETGWSRAEVARRTGFSPTYIGNLLQDRAPATKGGKPVRLSARTVDKIANVLKIPLDQARRAAGLAPPLSAHQSVAVKDPSPAGVEDLLLWYFRALPAGLRPNALAMVASYYQEVMAANAKADRTLAELGIKEGEEMEVIGRLAPG